MHLNSTLLFKKHLLPYFKSNIKILEIAPTGSPSAYQTIVNDPSIEWQTLDFENTTFIGNSVNYLTYKIIEPYSFPIKDESFDIVISGQVIEHVEKPWIWFKELKRITKKNGYILTISPVSWPYHEAPIDCWRIYPSGMKALAEETGLSVVQSFFESLEKELILKKDSKSKFIPGQSYNYQSNPKKTLLVIFWNKIIRCIPLLNKLLVIPIEVAYDCVTILNKKDEK